MMPQWYTIGGFSYIVSPTQNNPGRASWVIVPDQERSKNGQTP